MAESAGRYYLHMDIFDLCVNIHIFPYKKYQLWGYHLDWYDGPIHELGLGPLFYICTHDAKYIHPEEK